MLITATKLVSIMSNNIEYSKDFILEFQNKDNATLQTDIKENIFGLGIHKRPVSFAHRGRRKLFNHENYKNKHNSTNIPVLLTDRKITRKNEIEIKVDFNNLVNIKLGNNLQFPVIYFANARSMSNKIDELLCEINASNAHRVIITESWLNVSQNSNLFQIDGYTFIRKDRTSKKGGGVAVYIRSHLSPTHWKDLEEEDFEVIWISTRPTQQTTT